MKPWNEREACSINVAGCHKGEAYMDRARIEAFVKEFPFLKKHIYTGWNDGNIKVARADTQLLLLRGKYHSINWGGDPLGLGEDEIFFFDKDGEELGKVGYVLCYRNPNHKWWRIFSKEQKWLMEAPSSEILAQFRRVKYGESVGEGIERLNIAETVHYILCLMVIVPRRDSDSFCARAITIFKPPKSFSLAEWLRGHSEREAQAFREELTMTDRVGD